MKKIVVAVDFSTGSIHALEYAISIANKIKADILMVWVDKTSSTDSVYSVSAESYRGEVVKRFNELLEQYQPKLSGGKLEFKLRKGKIYNEIVGMARSKKAELIVTGSHGVAGFEEYWIGSNANRIVGNATCPVITVRNGFNITENVNKIVVPIDNNNHTLIKIPFTSQIAKVFNAEIHLLVIFSTNLKTIHKRVENFADKAEKYLHKEGVNFIVERIQSQNSTQATIKYAKTIEADLISIMTEQDERNDSGLLGPCAQQMVNHSHIPVLSVHVDDAKQTLKLIDQI